jgi:hypothetical protein
MPFHDGMTDAIAPDRGNDVARKVRTLTSAGRLPRPVKVVQHPSFGRREVRAGADLDGVALRVVYLNDATPLATNQR